MSVKTSTYRQEKLSFHSKKKSGETFCYELRCLSLSTPNHFSIVPRKRHLSEHNPEASSAPPTKRRLTMPLHDAQSLDGKK